MRRGPHPLTVHLGRALARANGVQNFVDALPAATYSREYVAEIIRGIQMYQQHPYRFQNLEKETVWGMGCARILRPCVKNDSELFVRYSGKKAPLLLVPSLINKSYIMDLVDNRSLLRWLARRGVEVYLFDWGDVAQEDKQKESVTLDFLIKKRLCEAVRWLSLEHSECANVLGYCMGGTMLVAATFLLSDYVGKQIYLATPWDFKASTKSIEDDLAKMIRLMSPFVKPEIERKGYLPSEYIQALFASLGTDGSVSKFIKFASMEQDTEEARLFVAAEDWLNDSVDLPGQIAKKCLDDWYLKNKTYEGEWEVDGCKIIPGTIFSDAMIIASKKDQLVPYESSVSLKNQLIGSNATLLEPDTGHIGMIVGNNAQEKVWKPMLKWLNA